MKRHRIETNPFVGIEQAREVPRERVLSLAELGAIWQACDALPPIWAGFVRTLILTMARRGEVAGMQWGEISVDMATWTLPSVSSKNRRAHIVHLVEPVRAILRSLPRIESNPYVFVGARTGRHLVGFSVVKATLSTALEQAGSPLQNWRVHDFRRSGVTWLAGAGFPPHVCDRLLNHVGGTLSTIALVYQRNEFLAERRAALDAWAAAVTARPK